jgi:hypothetical protein
LIFLFWSPDAQAEWLHEPKKGIGADGQAAAFGVVNGGP